MNPFSDLSDPTAKESFRMLPAVADPAAQAKAHDRPHYTAATGRNLLPGSPMPIGHYTGWTMADVPADYLGWVNCQRWAADWHAWQPVREYLTRVPALEPRLPWPLLCVSPLYPCEHSEEWPWTQRAKLSSHPNHEDKLHAFAVGALGLRTEWYRHPNRLEMPFYVLSPKKHALALQHGAKLLETRQELQQHADAWRRLLATCTKHCYATEQEATQTATERMRASRDRALYLRAYYCETCDFWHLTKKPLDA